MSLTQSLKCRAGGLKMAGGLLFVLVLCCVAELAFSAAVILQCDLNEKERSITLLATINDCTASEVLIFNQVRSNTRTNPTCAACFYIDKVPGNNYNLKYGPIDVIDYTRDQVFYVTLQCVDNTGTTQTSITVYVRILPNTTPFFNSLYEQATKTMAQLTSTGHDVSTKCSDNDVVNGDILMFSFVSTESSLFTLTTNGILYAIGNLNALCVDRVMFKISCKDNYGHVAANTFTLDLIISDGNKQPTMTGINYALDTMEINAPSLTLATFTVADGGGTPTCLMTSSQPDLYQFFTLTMGGSTGTITRVLTLDHEAFTPPATNLTIVCSDGYCTSPAAYVYVTITDVNEPIDLYPKDFTVTAYEESPSDRMNINPNWTPLDEDVGDTVTYTIVGGNTNGHFALNPTTGIITTTTIYDVDQGVMPTTDTILVQAKDGGGHMSTATVTISILDRNDHRPTFPAGSSLSATITDCPTTLGSVIGTVAAATDLDSAYQGNNLIHYTASAGPLSVSSIGEVIVTSSVTAGMTYTVTITAADYGEYPGPLTSSRSAVATVIVQACPTTTAAPTTTVATTTTTAPNVRTSSKENMGWIVVAVILGLLLLLAVGVVVWMFLFPNSICKPQYFSNAKTVQPRPTELQPRPMEYQPRPMEYQPKPMEYPPKPPHNGNRGFWRDGSRFTQDSFISTPGRGLTPSTVPVEINGEPSGRIRGLRPLEY